MTETIEPAAIDLEELVLGALLVDTSAMPLADNILKQDSFYDDRHNWIWQTIQSLYREASPIDITTVAKRLRKEGRYEQAGGAYYISQITNRVASAANVEYHCRLIEQYAMQRRLIAICQRTISEAYRNDADIFNILGKHYEQIKSPGLNVQGNNPLPENRTAKQLSIIDNACKGKINGVKIGLNYFDRTTLGFKKGNLIVCAGRPGMGKTAFALQCLHGAEVPTVMFQMEMSEEELASREIAMYSGINSERQNSGLLNEGEYSLIKTAINKINSSGRLVDVEPNISPIKVKSRLMHYIREHQVQLCVIDYLSLFDIPVKNRVQEIGKITRLLKLTAKELNVPIILLAQLSRNVENRGGSKKPILADLRDSGEIEQDADVVLLLHRPEYYDENTTEKNMVCIDIAKNRQGRTGNVWVGCDIAINKFYDIEQPTNNPF